MTIRKTMLITETINADGLGQPCATITRVAALVVIKNPDEGGKALIPSNAKVVAVGTSIDIPLGHENEAWSFSNFDTMTVIITDAPRPDEIVLCIAIAVGGRPPPRVGSGPIMD